MDQLFTWRLTSTTILHDQYATDFLYKGVDFIKKISFHS